MCASLRHSCIESIELPCGQDSVRARKIYARSEAGLILFSLARVNDVRARSDNKKAHRMQNRNIARIARIIAASGGPLVLGLAFKHRGRIRRNAKLALVSPTTQQAGHRATPSGIKPSLSSGKVAQSDHLARLRHDVKGALSPALLAADQIAMDKDPTTRAKAEQIIAAIEAASRLLSSRS